MTQRNVSTATNPDRRWIRLVPLICLALTGVVAFSAAWLSLPLGETQALAQSDQDSAQQAKKQKRNQEKIEKLEAEQRKNLEERAKLAKEKVADGVKPREKQRIENELKKKRREAEEIDVELKLRKLTKSEFAEEISTTEELIKAYKQQRTFAREDYEKIHCNKNATEKEKKAVKIRHEKANKKYFEARRRLKYLKKLSADRFGLGTIEQYRSDERKAEERLKRAWEEFRRRHQFRRILLPGDVDPDDPDDDSILDSLDFRLSLTCGPDETGTLTALTFPVEQKPITIAIQTPEICVGTTYTVIREEFFEEGLPLVTQEGEDPRDAPQPTGPIASVPKDVPGDGEDPRDTPREDIPVANIPEDGEDPRDTPEPEIPVASVPKDVPGDDPRDVPQEDTPENRTTDVPITSTPEFGDDPRDTPQKDVPDLGKVKAVAEIVALAVTSAVTGTPVTGVGVKFLPEAPPLPGSRAAQAASDAGDEFDETSFFEDEAEGGFTDESGEFELSTLPIGDTPPGQEVDSKPETPKKDKSPQPKNIADMELPELLKELDKIAKTPTGYDDMHEQLRKDKKFEKERRQLAFNQANEIDKLKMDNHYSDKPMDWKQLEKEEQKIRDKYEAAHEQLEDKYLKSKPKKFADAYRAARDRANTKSAKVRIIMDRLKEWDPAVVHRAREDIKKAQAKEAEKKKEKKQAELDPETVKKVLDGMRAAQEAMKKAIEEALKKALNDIRQFDDDTARVTSPVAAAGAAGKRQLSLPVDTEPKEAMVVALKDEAEIARAMEDELLTSLATNAFSIGQQPIIQISVPRQQSDEVKAQLKSRDWISWFEPDPCWSKQDVDDPYFSSEGLWGQKYDDQWAIKRAGFTEEMISAARDNGKAKPVIVAVIDTGVDWYHPDLDEKTLWRNENEIPDNGIDDDGNGYIDDIIGWNFIDQNNKPWDYDGHGTFIAGVIGAASGNGTGITGVNPHARIMPLKALDPFGQGYASMVAEAIMYAADNGAKVINISLGGKGISRVVDLAIDHAVSKGALVVVAAGNEAADVSGFGPAGSAGVITVSATDQRDRRAGFSNWGEEVDISAPGIDVMSLRARNTDLLAVIRGVEYDEGSAIVGDSRAYYRASGTSFAAPIVSGAASLLMSLNPDLDSHAVRRMLLNSARDIETPGIDNYVGYGLLDVGAALEADPNHIVESRITGAKPERVGGKSVLRLIGTADADDFADATVSLGKGKEPAKWLTIKRRIAEPVQAGVLMDIPAAAFEGSKEWTIRLITKHKNGSQRESRFVVTLG